MVYLKQVEKAYLKSKEKDFSEVKFGNNKFMLTRDVYNTNNKYIVKYEMYHYQTWILTVTFDFSHSNLSIELGHGYSASDRDNINSLLQCLEIYITQASIIGGCLMLNFNGYRTKLVSIKMGN